VPSAAAVIIGNEILTGKVCPLFRNALVLIYNMHFARFKTRTSNFYVIPFALDTPLFYTFIPKASFLFSKGKLFLFGLGLQT
jgi:hypothetical protein